MSEQDASDPEGSADDSGTDGSPGQDGRDSPDGSAAGSDETARRRTDATEDDDGTTAAGDDTDGKARADVDLDEEFAPSFDGEVDDEVVERVADSDPESVARELEALRARAEGLEGQLAARETEIEELEGKLKRKQADFQNFKKRMEKRQEQERRRATEDLVQRLTGVRDNLVRALDQDEDTDIRGGVETTLRVFDDALDAEDVDVVEPEAGTEVDPHRHEVLARVDSDAPAGTIAAVHRAGYVMADKVLRPAQVTVSQTSEDGDADQSGETEASG